MTLSLVLVGIMIGGVIYVISTVLKYTSFFSETVPAIKRLQRREESLAEGIESEEKLGEMIEDQIEQENIYLSKLKLEIGEVKEELRAAKAKTDKLEFQVYKTGKLLPGDKEGSR